MKTIFYSDSATPQKELSAEWFAGFNWENLEHGEIVWLEDNEETSKPAARFIELKDNKVWLYGVTYKIANQLFKVR